MKKIALCSVLLLGACADKHLTFDEHCPTVGVLNAAAEKGSVKITGLEHSCNANDEGYKLSAKVNFWAAGSGVLMVPYFVALVDGKKVIQRFDRTMKMTFKKDEKETWAEAKDDLQLTKDFVNKHKNLEVLYGLR